MGLLLNLKGLGHNVSVCSQLPPNHINILNRNGMPNQPLNSPPGYQIGDGKWVVGSNTGPVTSENGKMYKIKDVKFDLIHTTENRLVEYIKSFYPTTPQFNSDDDEGLDGDMIKKYKNALEW